MALNLIPLPLFFLFITFLQINGYVKLISIYCQSLDPSFCQFEYCRLKVIGREVSELSLKVKLLQTPVTNVTSKIQVFKRYNGYKPFLFDVEADFCSLLLKQKQTFTRILFEMIADHSNMNHSCPYVGDITLDKFVLRDGMLKIPFPTGLYRINLTMKAYEVPRALVMVTGIIREDEHN